MTYKPRRYAEITECIFFSNSGNETVARKEKKKKRKEKKKRREKSHKNSYLLSEKEYMANGLVRGT